MKVALLLAGALAANAVPQDVLREEFLAFVHKYGREYRGEELLSFEIFSRNYEFVQETNAKSLPYTLAINEFSDTTTEEFAETHLGYVEPPEEMVPHLGRHTWNGERLPRSVDWTTQGAVTPVKNQGGCGSCWSFSATGALEGAFAIAGGGLVSMSEQQLVDCACKAGHSGCQGGSSMRAFTYLHTRHVCTEASYPYDAQYGTCKNRGCTAAIARGGVKGYTAVSHDEQSLMSAAAQQPVSVGIEAKQASFMHYKSGVLTAACGSSVDHAVLVVGYGTDGVDYWKVKNSWGSRWGDHGYVRLERGLSGAGQCGILSRPKYPSVHRPGLPLPATIAV